MGQMELHQTKKLLHSKKNNQSEKKICRIGEIFLPAIHLTECINNF
jgi:hypothetical protein